MFSRLTEIERSPRNSRMLMRSSGNRSLECARDRAFDLLVFVQEAHERARRRVEVWRPLRRFRLSSAWSAVDAVRRKGACRPRSASEA